MAPIVREYTANVEPTGPDQTRQARDLDTGNVGNAVANLGNTISTVGKQLQQRDAQAEITQTMAAMSQAHVDTAQDLDDTMQNADPYDRTITEKFTDRYDDRMADIGDNLQTPQAQQYFARANSEMRQQFQTRAMSQQAALAGQNAVDTLQTSQEKYSASLLSDPSQLDSVKELHAMAIQAMVDNSDNHLTQAHADELRAQADTKFTMAAVRGSFAIDPQATKTQLMSGKFDSDLNGDQKYALEKEADASINGQRIEQQRRQSQADQAAADLREAMMEQSLAKMYSPQGLSTKDILDPKSPLLFSQQKELLGMVEKASSDKLKTDPTTFINLFNRIHSPDGDPQKISDPDQLNSYVSKGLLDIPGLQQLRNEVKEKNTPQGQDAAQLKTNFLSMVKSQMTKTDPSIGLRDPDGDALYQGFLGRFLPAYTQAVKNGKDPSTLLTPGSKDYMGNLIPPPRSPEQVFNSMSQRIQPTQAAPASGSPGAAATTTNASSQKQVTAEPRRKGETPDDYLKRIGSP